MKTLLLFLSLIVTTSQAATVRLYFTDPLTNDKDTNAFYITPIGTNVLSSGGVVGRGVATRYVPASNGYRTNTLAVGHYSITNRSLGSGVVIRVPDSSSLYDYTNILISGYNIFVTITNGDSGTTYTNNTGLPGVVLGSGIGTNMTTLATQAGLAAGSYAVAGANVFSAGTTNLYSANSKNNYSIGTNLTILSAGSHNNVMLGGNSGEIENSIYSTIIGSNPGGSQIRRSSTSVMISANDGNMTDATGCVILGGEHPWIFGGVGALAGHYNVIIGGNTAAIGNEFDSSKYVRGNVIAGGQENRIEESVFGNAIIAGANNIVNNATNSFTAGSQNYISGHNIVGLGSLLTNTQNHEVMLGKHGTELRVMTNGVTLIKYVSMQGGTSSGNITNTSSWQFGLGGTATGTLYTNGTRRGTLCFSGETAEFGAMVAASIVTYDQNNSNTNTWGKQTIFDDGSIAGSISLTAPVNPSQVYYVNTYGSSVTTTFFKIVFE